MQSRHVSYLYTSLFAAHCLVEQRAYASLKIFLWYYSVSVKQFPSNICPDIHMHAVSCLNKAVAIIVETLQSSN